MQLEDIKGIGSTTAEKLRKAGIASVEDLATMHVEELKSILGVSFKVAKEIQQDALDKTLNEIVKVQLFSETEKHMKETRKFISTGSKELDRILGGGIRTDAITLVFGEFASLKTQLAHQLAINCLDQIPDSKVMFIETESGCFSPARLKEIKPLSGNIPNYDRIFHIPARTIALPSHQYLAYLRTKKLLEEGEPIKLIIVDCLAPDTEILTPKGLVKIKDLDSDVVSFIGRRSKLVKTVVAPISAKVSKNHPVMLRIETPYRELVCSKEHRLFKAGSSNTYGKRLIETRACELKVGDRIYALKELDEQTVLDSTESKDPLVVPEPIKRIEEVEGGLTYEITVPEFETYIANGLLVHNSFTAKFRGYYQKREQLADRSEEFARHFMLLDTLASKYNLAVFLTAQVMGIPTSDQEQVKALGRPESVKYGLRGQKLWGGNILTHSATYILALSQGAKKDPYWKAELLDAPDLPSQECYFVVRPEGIRDYIGKPKKGEE